VTGFHESTVDNRAPVSGCRRADHLGCFYVPRRIYSRKTEVFVFLSICFKVIDLMLPCAWAECIDISRQYSVAVSGAMNTAGKHYGFVCASLFGYPVDATGNYNFPLLFIFWMLVINAFLFMQIAPSKELVEKVLL
jgi:hypothetical protein